MQFLGPALNGMNEYGFVPSKLSNRLGSNFSGFGKYSGFLCIPYVNTVIVTSSGIISPSKRKFLKIGTLFGFFNFY